MSKRHHYEKIAAVSVIRANVPVLQKGHAHSK